MKGIKLQKVSLFSLVLLIFFSMNFVVVDANTVSDEEQTFKIEIPSDYTIVLKDSVLNKQAFDQQTLDYFMNYLENNSLFSLGITEDLVNEIEIYIEVSDREEYSFSQIDDDELLEFGEETLTKVNEVIPEGIISYPLSIYENESAKFIVIQSEDGSGFLTQFLTIHNNSLYNISFRNNEIKDNIVAAKRIIDTMVMSAEAKDSKIDSAYAERFIVGFLKVLIPGLIVAFIYSKLEKRKQKTDIS